MRGANASLRHPYDANEVPRPKLLTWNEGANTYSTRATEGISGDDLMRAAWALTSTTPEPARPYPYLRKKVGACTRPADAMAGGLKGATSGRAVLIREEQADRSVSAGGVRRDGGDVHAGIGQ